MKDPGPRLSDEDAQKVIARALEIQTQNDGTLTVTQIREIASELSIPESAVDQALAEYHAAGLTAASAHADAASTGTFSIERRGSHRGMVRLALVGGAFVLVILFSLISRLFP